MRHIWRKSDFYCKFWQGLALSISASNSTHSPFARDSPPVQDGVAISVRIPEPHGWKLPAICYKLLGTRERRRATAERTLWQLDCNRRALQVALNFLLRAAKSKLDVQPESACEPLQSSIRCPLPKSPGLIWRSQRTTPSGLRSRNTPFWIYGQLGTSCWMCRSGTPLNAQSRSPKTLYESCEARNRQSLHPGSFTEFDLIP